MHSMSEADLAWRAKLKGLGAHLRGRILGQDEVLRRVSAALLRGELGLRRHGRPRGSFLFLGPSGVGKTETAQAFTRYLFEDGMMRRFDMSEYQTPESLSSLVGREPGDLGSVGGWCSSKCAGTLLFDEIEKAHPRILDVFLQVLDAARLSLACGMTVDLSGFYVVFTSNLGSRESMELEHSSFATMERHVLVRAQQHMRAELYARIQEKLVFNRLSYGVQLEIAADLLRREVEFMSERGVCFLVDPGVLPFVVRQGYHSKLGARPMRDAVERLVGDAVVDWLLDVGPGGGANTLKVAPGTERLCLVRA
jgi:ATP-dependent Clp protease ATP-binding subunit ClpB